MKNLHSIVAMFPLALLALAFPVTGAAQAGRNAGVGGLMGGRLPRGVFNPVVGSGAQYEVQPANGQNKMTLEVDVVGKETMAGKDAYWIEATISNTPMGDVTMKMLMAVDHENETVQKMIMQMPGHPPMELPSQMTGGGQAKDSLDIRDKADKVGSESVTTAAGTFMADHYRMKDGSGDYWLSAKVPPYSVIKGQGKDGSIMLTKVVTDAKDKITGTPVPFNPALLLPTAPPAH